MANDVSIIVSAELGDTLIKLDLAKHAISDLGDESLETAAKQDEAAASTAFFDGALQGLNDALATSIPLFGGFAAPLGAMPVVLAGAAVAVIALADVLGTLIAIFADLVAPITLVTGLLGGLAAGFFFAAKQAFGSGGGLSGQLEVLKHQFDNLTKALAQDFMPVFGFLIKNAHDALTYLNQIAKLPLDQAFKSLATTGVQAVSKFLEQVGHIVARPIRLAFQIAFGTGKGGNEVASVVSGLWKQFTDFLFGYSQTHPIRLPSGRVIQLDKSHVDGIFQPLIDWFNRHDFTAQGQKIGHAILSGFLDSGASKRISQSLASDITDAINIVEHRMTQAIGENAVSFIVSHWQQIVHAITDTVNPLTTIASFIRDRIGGAVASIVDRFGSVQDAINVAKGIANDFLGILHQIAAFFSHVFTLNINWPSPPSWLTSLGGLLGGGGGPSRDAGRTGQGGQVAQVMGGNAQVHVHLHGNFELSNQAHLARVAHKLGREITRQQLVLAGGS